MAVDSKRRGRPAIDMTGQRFGRWVVICRAPRRPMKEPYWMCRCDCGTERAVRGSRLRYGGSTSCGCSGGGPFVIDLTGRRFGNWVVLGRSLRPAPRPHWICRCDCGSVRHVQGGNLCSGGSLSCGCLNLGRLPKHGMYQTPEYRAWDSMKRRCLRSDHKSYANYGGRGITVCAEWQDSFEAFYEHVGPRPGSGYSLDRIDNDGNYEPGNVRWATWKQQANNRRKQKGKK